MTSQKDAKFRFEESDLSPALRQAITNNAERLTQINPLRHRVFELGESEARERGNFNLNVVFGIILLIVGALVLFASPIAGSIVVVLGLIGVYRAFQILKPRYLQLASTKEQQGSEVDWMQAQLDASMDSLAKSIMSELSELHEQKIHPKQVNLNVNMNLDFQWLRDRMDKGGLLLTTVKCPQCGGKLTLPKQGSLTKCRYCGADVYAQDIFDKLKGLLK